jgi:hypothetical protein
VLVAIIMIVIGFTSQVRAQETAASSVFKIEELDQMLAPIALYPDDVLANVLMAATYPLEVAQAARWRKESSNAKLKGDALSKALEAKSWDPSVKALTQFSDVLQLMSDELEWTQKLGDAFLAQEDDVFARIQFLRQKADEAGNLKTTKKQKVTKKERSSSGSGTSGGAAQQQYYYVIEPVDPEVVYIPVYEPAVAYGTWWYPNYEPYYWDWYPGSTLASGFFWGAGFAIANNLWGWGHCDWNRGDIDIDIDRFNNINVNRPKITNGKWEHNPRNRGPVPYRDKASREKFANNNKLKDARKDFRGFDKDKMDKSSVDRVKDKLGGEGASKIKDKMGEGGASKIKDKMGDGGAERIKDKLGEGGGSKIKDKAGDRGGQKIKDKAADRDKSKVASRDVKKPSKKASSKAASKSFDVKPKAQVKKQVNRGNVSRKSAASHRGGGRSVSRGGGGRSMGGGGGRRGGGGGRGGGRRSDIRLKTDIVPLVRLDNGLELYRFRYKGNDHTAYVGVMAQEVQKIEPRAVWSDGNGYLMVDYDRIGLKFMTWKEWLTHRGERPSSPCLSVRHSSDSVCRY